MSIDRSDNHRAGVRSAVKLDDIVKAADAGAGLALETLSRGTTLAVRTENTTYRLLVRDPGRGAVRIQGGRHFVDPTPVLIVGATFTGVAVKRGWIGLGMRLELHGDDGAILTSPVRSIALEYRRPPVVAAPGCIRVERPVAVERKERDHWA